MVSIPALAEADLGDVIEGEFGTSVTLITPEGDRIDSTVNGKPLKGFVRHSYAEASDQRGAASDRVIVNSPIVKLRAASLSKIPVTGTKWMIGIPADLNEETEIEWYALNPDKPVEHNRDRGTIKLFLMKMRAAP